MKNVEIDPDIKKEYANQKTYLQSSHHSLQKRLEKEDQIHRQDNLNVMNENQKLINDINELRGQVKEYRLLVKNKNSEEIQANGGKRADQDSQNDSMIEQTEMPKNEDEQDQEIGRL